MPAIVGDRVDQPRQQKWPKRVELCRQRIRERDSGLTAARSKGLRRGRFHESECDRFRKTGPGENLPHELVAADSGIRWRRRRGDDRERGGQLVEAEMAADLLDQIDFANEIDAERRNDRVPAIRCDSYGKTQA